MTRKGVQKCSVIEFFFFFQKKGDAEKIRQSVMRKYGNCKLGSRNAVA